MIQTKQWTANETEFLKKLYELQQNRRLADLADECAKTFGRAVSENTVKGVIYRIKHGEAGQPIDEVGFGRFEP